MGDNVIKLIKKILFAAFILYSFNLIAVNFNIILPINIYTLLIITLLDIPGMVMILFSMIIILN